MKQKTDFVLPRTPELVLLGSRAAASAPAYKLMSFLALARNVRAVLRLKK